MEKIKSRWRKKYLEGDTDHGDDEPLSYNNTDKPPHYEPLSENLYLDRRKDDHKSHKRHRSMLCDCTLTKEERNRGMMGCVNDCLNRMLMIECGPKCNLNDRCLNKRFQRCLTARVEVFKTRKKGWGLRTIEDLPVNAFIMEYVGEVVRLKEFRKRVKKYTKQKIKHHYFMALQNDEIIDATVRGNLTRFINHSCEPNSETQKWTVNGELRIGFFTLRPLHAGEEITFDYQFQRYGRKAQKCYCEAPSCRGYIGGNDQTFSLNGNSSPLEEEDDDDKQTEDKPVTYKIPKFERRLDLEDEEERNFERLEPKHPFSSRNYFNHDHKLTTTSSSNTTSSTTTTTTTNGFVNNLAKRRRGNNIELTPAPQMSKEEHRQQFEMNVRLKEYYDTLEKHYGMKLCQTFPYIYWPNLNEPPPQSQYQTPMPPHSQSQIQPQIQPPLQTQPHIQPQAPSQPVAPAPPQTPPSPGLSHGELEIRPPKPTDWPTTLVLANNNIEPALAIADELAFSICNYVKSPTVKPLTADDVIGRFYPFPGSYYTTPDGDKWFATITLDRKTRKPRPVTLNLKSRSKFVG